MMQELGGNTAREPCSETRAFRRRWGSRGRAGLVKPLRRSLKDQRVARRCLGMTTFTEAWDRAQRIEGWLTEGQARLLYQTAASVQPDQAIVEIGSHHGRSTVILASAKQNGAKVLAIDPYEDPRWGGGESSLKTFLTNLRVNGLDQDVELRRGYGADVGGSWDGEPVGMVFVDGAHDFPSVNADLSSWLPHLAGGGVVLIHDTYSSPGVTRAVFRHMFGSSVFAYVGSARTLTAFRRKDQALSARLLSGVRMIGKLPWMARNLTVKVALRRNLRAAAVLLGHRSRAMPY